MTKFFWIFLLSMAPIGAILNAQTLWEAQDVQLRYGVKGMYYDSVEEKSFIHGRFPLYIDGGDSTNIVIYDGLSYYSLPKSPVYDVWTMVRYKGKLFAGGMGLAGLAVWDGLNWEVIEPEGAFFNLKVIDDKLFAMGNFNQIAGVTCRGIGVWNDTAWSGFLGTDTIVASGNTVSDITFYKGSTYICGNFYKPDVFINHDLMRYNGEKWIPVGDFTIGGLGGLDKMAVWRDTLYVMGMMGEGSGAPGNCIAAWDGNNWHRLQSGIGSPAEGSSSIRDFRIYHDELWVAGHFTVVNNHFTSPNHGSVAKWDGSKWCTMNFRRTGNATGLGAWKDELFIVGEVHMLEDTSAKRIVKWVGEDYSDTCIEDAPTKVDAINIKNLHFQIYPNPTTNGIFYLTFPNNGIITQGEKLQLSLTDLYGRSISLATQVISNGINKFIINTPAQLPGVYCLNIIVGNRHQTYKLVKL